MKQKDHVPDGPGQETGSIGAEKERPLPEPVTISGIMGSAGNADFHERTFRR